MIDYQLDDKAIRIALIAKLSRLSKPPKAILQEVRVHNGNAIADIVTIHSTAHCYEIKGEADSIYRAIKQSYFYDLAFKKVTLVTTKNHLNNALRLLPSHWGVIVASSSDGEVKFNHFRRAIPSKKFDKRIALLTLWKSELVEVAQKLEIEKAEKYNRAKLTELVSMALGDLDANKNIGEQLLKRKGEHLNFSS